MTELATATFPDGTLPEVDDVMLIAANLFAAGGETTARLLGTMLRSSASAPSCSSCCATSASCIPSFVEETLRLESPDPGRVPAGARARRRSAASTCPRAPP